MELYEFTDLASRLEAIASFDDMSGDDMLQELVERLRPHLQKVIGVTIGKGGETKTTLATNLAYMLAEEQALRFERGKSALPVLYLELDHNGDSKTDFGLLRRIQEHVFATHTGSEQEAQEEVKRLFKAIDDDGKSLRDAITDDGNLKVVRGIRPFLDFTISGKWCSDIPTRLGRLQDAHGLPAFLLLALLLAQISHLYSWIVIDFAPGDKAVQRSGLAAATHLVAPIHNTDDAALRGVATVARLVRSNRRLNPQVDLIAVVFVGFRKVEGEATSELTNPRDKLAAMLAGAGMDPNIILDEYIRDARKLAALCRNQGRPAREFALAAAGRLVDLGGAPVPRPRDDNGRYADADASAKLANDYSQLARALLGRVRQHNTELRDQQMQVAS